MENIKVQKNNITFYKVFWIFVIGGFIGFLIETVWCRFTYGELTSRTSNLFFPMSCVWGLGSVAVCLSLKNDSKAHWLYIFAKSVPVCAFFEFLCGYIGEAVMGVTFWDYSSMPLHIGRYVNVPFCIAWGVISIIWVKCIYPFIDEKLTVFLENTNISLSRMFLVFMVVTNMVSGLALIRMHERQTVVEPSNRIEHMLDRAFPDYKMQMYFPKMKDAMTGEKIYALK